MHDCRIIQSADYRSGIIAILITCDLVRPHENCHRSSFLVKYLKEDDAVVPLLGGCCTPCYEHTNNGLIEFFRPLSPPAHITTSAKCRSWFGIGSEGPTISAMCCGTSYTSRSSYLLLMRCRSLWPSRQTMYESCSIWVGNIPGHYTASYFACCVCRQSFLHDLYAL